MSAGPQIGPRGETGNQPVADVQGRRVDNTARPSDSNLSFEEMFEEMFDRNQPQSTSNPTARELINSYRQRIDQRRSQNDTPPQANSNTIPSRSIDISAQVGDYPQPPIEESIEDRLLGDIARTDGGDALKISDRFAKYGSPALSAVASVLATEQITINNAQKEKENEPIEKRWLTGLRKWAGNFAVMGVGLFANSIGGPLLAAGVRAVGTGVRGWMEYGKKATLEGASQLYKHRVSSLENAKGFLEKSRKMLSSGERLALEKAFGVIERDTKILALLNQGLVFGDPKFITISANGIENPEVVYSRIQEITGGDLNPNDPAATNKLENSSELLKELYAQSILSGYSEQVSPEKIKAYADLVTMISSSYSQAINKHRDLHTRNPENILTLQEVWEETQENVKEILSNGRLLYAGGAAVGSLVKSTILAGIGYGIGQVLENIKAGTEVVSPMGGNETNGRQLEWGRIGDDIRQGGNEVDIVDTTQSNTSGFHDQARDLLNMEGDGYDNYLGVDERTHRIQFIEMVSMTKDAQIMNDNLSIFEKFMQDNDVTLEELEKAVVKGRLDESWGVSMDQARTLISTGKLEQLIQQIMSLTGKSEADAINFISETDLLTKIDATAQQMGIPSNDLIKTLTLRGGIPSGSHSGVNILARILTDQVTPGDMNSLKEMLTYTSNVNAGFYTLAQNSISGSVSSTISQASDNISEVESLETLSETGETINYLGNGNSVDEAYPYVSGDYSHEQFMNSFKEELEKGIPGVEVEEYLDSTNINGQARLTRLSFFEMVDLAKDEESSRYYIQLLRDIAQNQDLTIEEVKEISISGNIPSSWGLTDQQEAVLPSAARLTDFVNALAEKTGTSESQILDELAGTKFVNLVDKYAESTGLSRNQIIEALMVRGELAFTGKYEGSDEMLLRILSQEKVSPQELNDINVLLDNWGVKGSQSQVNPLWFDFAEKIITKEGDEILSVGEMGYSTLEEYYESNGISQVFGGSDRELNETLIENTRATRGIYSVVANIFGLGAITGISGLAALMEVGNYKGNTSTFSASTTSSNTMSDSTSQTSINPNELTQFINASPEYFGREGEVVDGYFGTVSAHITYRWMRSENSETRGNGVFHTKESFIKWLRDDNSLNSESKYPNLLSVISLAQNSLIPETRDIKLKRRFEDMLTSEEGTIEVMKYLALDLAFKGDFESAKKMYQLRKHIIDNDVSILQITVDRVVNRDNNYSEYVNRIQSNPNQITDRDRDFLRFYIMHHQQFESDERITFPDEWYRDRYTRNSFFNMV